MKPTRLLIGLTATFATVIGLAGTGPEARLVGGANLAPAAAYAAAVPQPARFPTSWQLDFDYGKLRRIVVETPGSRIPQAYWYLPFEVTNNTDEAQLFLPVFDMVTRDGRVIRSDVAVSPTVFRRIKATANLEFARPLLEVAGRIPVGQDQTRSSVAIWKEPDPEMGSFSIFVAGLSGEMTTVPGVDGQPLTDADGEPILLRKSRQLEYRVLGDELYPGQDPIELVNDTWVMR
ncbi:MAG: hypothetical protein ACFCVE_08930 [Phycisphaerae bacterium]